NGSSTTVGSGVTVASDSPIVMNVNNGTLLNNGMITSSAPANSESFGSSSIAVKSIQALFGSTISIESLEGPLTLDSSSSGQISVTGGGTNPFNFFAAGIIGIGATISVLAFGSNSVNINGSYTFNTGSHGFVQIGKVNRNVDGTVNMSGSVNVGPNV